MILSSAAWGQQWGLEECIKYAIDNNIQVKQGDLDIENATTGVLQSKLDYIPSLGANATQSTSFGRSLDPTTYSFIDNETVANLNGGISLQTTAFAGMTKLHTLSKSKLNLQSYIANNEKLKNEITLSVTSAFLQVLYAKEQIGTSTSQIELLQIQLERTIKLVEAGSKPLGARLELESQLAQEQFNLVSYKNQLDVALLSLKQLLEIRQMPDFDIVVPDLSRFHKMPIADMDSTYSNALGLPQIRAAIIAHEISKEEVSLAKSKFYPTLNLSANYGSTWSDARTKPQINAGQVIQTFYPFFSQLGDNASTSIQLSLNVPIFSSLRSQNNLKIAKRNEKRSMLEVTLIENRLYKEIQQAFVDATAAKQKYLSASTAVTSSQKSFEYAEQKFNAGATTVVDYNLAKNNLIIALSSQTQAKYEYILKSKILDFYNGIEITL